MAPAPSRPTPPWPLFRPLKPDRWLAHLTHLNITHAHARLIDALNSGFSWNSTIDINTTLVYPHHSSARLNPSAVLDKIDTELASDRYIGPFSKQELEALIGPFIAHPLGVVTKSNGKWRVIEDLSWPRKGSQPSLNSLSDNSDFSLGWSGLAEMAALVISAPPGAEFATIDWADAFRMLGIRTDELWRGIVHWEGKFYVDRAGKFGGSAIPFQFDLVGAAFKEIITRSLPILAAYWVDDVAACRFPTNSSPPYTYNVELDQITAIGEDLGGSFPESKRSPFSPTVQYIGFLWDGDSKSVHLPEKKRLAVLELLAETMTQPTISLEALRTLTGKLSHCALIIPLGRSQLRPFWSLLRTMEEKAYTSKTAWTLSPSHRASLEWWSSMLAQPRVGMQLCTQAVPDDSFGLYCDASSSFGIGVVIKGQFDLFQLSPDWRTSGDSPRDIGWAEFAAVEIIVSFLLQTYNLFNTHVLVHTDNKGVLGAWNKRSSRNVAQNEVLSHVLSSLLDRKCFLSLMYVPSASNPADFPSRGVPAPGCSRRSFKGFPSSLAGLMHRPHQL